MEIKHKRSNGEKMLDFRKIFAIVEKNFIVMTRDKIRLVPLLIFPIVMIVVLGFVSGNSPKGIPATILVYEDSPIAHDLIQKIGGSQFFSLKYTVSTEGEARGLLDRGKVRVIIEIPPNLEEDVAAGVPVKIIVIVDESDSSVAMTSKQVLNSIINQEAAEITMKKFGSYQRSVYLASQQMSYYISQFPDKYSSIKSDVELARFYASSSKKLIDTEADILNLIPSTPAQIILPGDTNLSFHNKLYRLENDTLFQEKSSQQDAIDAQQYLISQSSALAQSSVDRLNSAGKTIDSAQQQMISIKGRDYQEKVVNSLTAISIFTQANAASTMHPLVYEEKPAYGTGKTTTDFLIPSLIALTIFQGAVMMMGRAIAGEKREGSLTRVFLTPTSNITIISGTLLFYVLFELLRATFLIIVSVLLFNVKIEGSILLIGLILIIFITISSSIGLIISTMVKSEQQYMAMAMLVSLPTMFLSGAFFPVQAMPKFMQSISIVLPVTYASDALRRVMVKGLPLEMIIIPLSVLILFLVLCIAGVITFFKREIE